MDVFVRRNPDNKIVKNSPFLANSSDLRKRLLCK